jgi:hypothetical protein
VIHIPTKNIYFNDETYLEILDLQRLWDQPDFKETVKKAIQDAHSKAFPEKHSTTIINKKSE